MELWWNFFVLKISNLKEFLELWWNFDGTLVELWWNFGGTFLY